MASPNQCANAEMQAAVDSGVEPLAPPPQVGPVASEPTGPRDAEAHAAGSGADPLEPAQGVAPVSSAPARGGDSSSSPLEESLKLLLEGQSKLRSVVVGSTYVDTWKEGMANLTEGVNALLAALHSQPLTHPRRSRSISAWPLPSTSFVASGAAATPTQAPAMTTSPSDFTVFKRLQAELSAAPPLPVVPIDSDLSMPSSGAASPTFSAGTASPREPVGETPNQQYAAVLKEIIQTEARYVSSLHCCIQYYLVPLRELAGQVDPVTCATQKTLYITSKDVNNIFSNMESIFLCNSYFLNKLETSWSQAAQSVGNLFHYMAPFMKIYTQYITNYPISTATLKQFSGNPAFVSFLKQCEQSAPRDVDAWLPSLLISPIQRIPRYVLLLSDLIRHTPSTHPEHKTLSLALDKMKEVAVHLNESKRTIENSSKTVQIQMEITNLPLNLVEPHRRFIRQGQVTKWTDVSSYQLYLFMFSDVLVCTTPSPHRFLKMYPLEELRLRKFSFDRSSFRSSKPSTTSVSTLPPHVPVNRNGPSESAMKNIRHAFVLVHHSLFHRDELVLSCSSQKESHEWWTDLHLNINLNRTKNLQDWKLEGFLLKRSDTLKQWRRRFFRLRPEHLVYYLPENLETPKMTFDLSTFELRLADDKRPCTFELHSLSGGMSYFLQAENEEMLKLWLTNIRVYIGSVDSHVLERFLGGPALLHLHPSSLDSVRIKSMEVDPALTARWR